MENVQKHELFNRRVLLATRARILPRSISHLGYFGGARTFYGHRVLNDVTTELKLPYAVQRNRVAVQEFATVASKDERKDSNELRLFFPFHTWAP